MSRFRFASRARKSTSTSVGCAVGGAAAGTVASSAVKAPSKAAAAATFAVADAAAATFAAGFLRGLLFGRWRFAFGGAPHRRAPAFADVPPLKPASRGPPRPHEVAGGERDVTVRGRPWLLIGCTVCL